MTSPTIRRFRTLAASSASLLFAVLVLCAGPPDAQAVWAPHGTPVCTTPANQNRPAATATFNGALVFWTDSRNGTEDIYGRFLDSTGTMASGEIPIAIMPGFQNGPAAFADGSGGGFVAWNDYRNGNYDIFAQRVVGGGGPQWTANGVAVAVAPNFQRFPVIAGDGLNSTTGTLPGAWVAWQDERTGTADVYLRHLTTNGVAGAEVPVCNEAGAQTSPVITADGVSSVNVPAGAVVGWIDERITGNQNIYAQRVSSAGAAQWTANGIAVCSASGYQNELKVARIGQNYLFVWKDGRGFESRIYAQKVNASGTLLWAANGVAVGTSEAGLQASPVAIQSSDGSFIIAWTDSRNGSWDIYAQRLDTNGVPMWGEGGIPICQAIGQQTAPLLTNNPAGAVVVAWLDTRSSAEADLYAQRVQASGDINWPTNGIPICTVSGTTSRPRMVTSGSGAILAWDDDRNGNDDVFALRIAPNLVVDAPAVPSSSFRLALRSANPTRGEVRLGLTLAEEAEVSVDVYDLSGRRVRSILGPSRWDAGPSVVSWDGRDERGATMPAGVYLVRARAGHVESSLKVVRLP